MERLLSVEMVTNLILEYKMESVLTLFFAGLIGFWLGMITMGVIFRRLAKYDVKN